MARVPTSAASPRLWFAVIGAPAAWSLQMLAIYWVTQARCSPAGPFGISLDTWAVVLTIAAAAVATLAELVAIGLFRATLDAETEGAPPQGRIRFLAIIGIAITPLFAFMILMNGVGGVILGCTGS